ncbi:MAG: hypothetical protein R3231_11900 [bacterium]|nr:hypothetical protein [bacterium]
MDLINITAYFTELFQRNLYLTLAVGALFLIALFKKPKLVVSGVGMALFFAGVFYFISILSEPGVAHKEKMVSPLANDRAAD